MYQKVLNGLFPSQNFGGLLGNPAIQNAQNQGLLSFGAAMMAAGGPSVGKPVSFGQALSQGLQAGNQAFNQSTGTGLQIAEAKRQKEAFELAQKQEAQKAITRARQEAHREKLAAAYDNSNPQLAAAIRAGDNEVVKSLLAEKKGPTPHTKMAKLNADLNSGLITKAQYDAEVAALGETSALDANQTFTAEQKLYDQFQKATETPREQVAAYRRVEAIYRNPAEDRVRQIKVGDEVFTADGQGAADLALIFNYMKMLDPGSVVREGEFALARKAGSVPQQVKAYLNSVVNGGQLDPVTRKRLVAQARNQYNSAAESIDTTYKRLLKRGEGYRKLGVDPVRAIDYQPYTPMLSTSLFAEGSGEEKPTEVNAVGGTSDYGENPASALSDDDIRSGLGIK